MKVFALIASFALYVYVCIGLIPVSAVEKPTITDNALNPAITVMVLHNGKGVPAGWADSTTRPDATNMCNQLIATQSKEDATPHSKSRCIIQVQEW